MNKFPVAIMARNSKNGYYLPLLGVLFFRKFMKICIILEESHLYNYLSLFYDMFKLCIILKNCFKPLENLKKLTIKIYGPFKLKESLGPP